MGKLFFAALLLLIAVAVGFGATALFVYHQFNGHLASTDQSARGVSAEHRMVSRQPQTGMDGSAQPRLVAALPSDQPRYTYADNNGGRPSVPAKNRLAAVNVPAPLEMPSQLAGSQDAPPALNDPESHYIRDSRTGKVIGIDGSAGAEREQEQEALQQAQTPTTARVAVQTPPPEVRVASAVVEDGRPVFHGMPVATDNTSGSQYVPVRKALPVTFDDSSAPCTDFQRRRIHDQRR